MLKSVKNRRVWDVVNETTYQYDLLGRRTHMHQDGQDFDGYDPHGIVTTYHYNDRSELIQAKTYPSDAAQLPERDALKGRIFTYAYDHQGNRIRNQKNDQPDFDAVFNSRNQMTLREASPMFAVSGFADPSATVAVTWSKEKGFRSGQYFYADYRENAGAAPVYGNRVVRFAKPGAGSGGADQTWSAWSPAAQFIAKTAESYAFNDDGQQENDTQFIYRWNAAGRIAEIETSPAAIAAGTPGEKLIFTYDHLGRRVKKDVYWRNVNTGVYYLDYKRTYAYHGWNLIAEMDGSGGIIRSYFWRNDISGTPQGAGGIGGLLMMHDHATSQTYLPFWDGHGNIVGWLRNASHVVSGTLEYAPYGEMVRKEVRVELQSMDLMGFSTKLRDQETGLLYYGHRHYSPQDGRFLSRDPIHEAGGTNLYSAFRNDPINNVDVLGMIFEHIRANGAGISIGHPSTLGVGSAHGDSHSGGTAGFFQSFGQGFQSVGRGFGAHFAHNYISNFSNSPIERERSKFVRSMTDQFSNALFDNPGTAIQGLLFNATYHGDAYTSGQIVASLAHGVALSTVLRTPYLGIPANAFINSASIEGKASAPIAFMYDTLGPENTTRVVDRFIQEMPNMDDPIYAINNANISVSIGDGDRGRVISSVRIADKSGYRQFSRDLNEYENSKIKSVTINTRTGEMSISIDEDSDETESSQGDD